MNLVKWNKRSLIAILLMTGFCQLSLAQQEQKTTYEYDKQNRLIHVVSPLGETIYTYDELGNRLSKIFKASAVKKAGDVNGDGKVDATDIMEVVNYIMGKSSTNFSKQSADVNKDNIINIADIIQIANIILIQ
jgi:YD repeat-containing protein